MKLLKHPNGELVEFKDEAHADRLMAMAKTRKGNGGWTEPSKQEIEKYESNASNNKSNKRKAKKADSRTDA